VNCFTFFLTFHSKNKSSEEERQFGAWGEVDFFKIHGQEADFSDSILARGFTGHEHFSEVALIHMNGRMYDPQLRRFLSPDNFIQDPYDTRSYDRFGYVWHNPLMLNDPSGEFILAALALAVTSGLARGISGHEGFFEGFGKGFSNTFKIIGGVLAFDPNLSVGQNIVNVISRFTWELPQTLVGLAYNLGHNLTGQVNWVKYKYGATVVQSRIQTKGITLGSYITGNTSIEADANNSLFQHEYGHVLQSRAFGWSYFARVGIPSLLDNDAYDRHAFHPVEADANRRAFLYFNENVRGFQDDEFGKYNDGKGWDFIHNQFQDGVGVKRRVSTIDERQINYVDYQNQSHVLSLNQIIFRPKWYDFLDPFGLNGIGFYNTAQYNNKKN